MHIILASQSPRRKELLSKIFDSFECMPQNVEENIKESNPIFLVEKLALKKLNNLDEMYKDSLIISADTIVFYNNKEYGKPKDIEDAKNMLFELSNKTHEVYTGVCVAYKGERHVFYESSKVKFKKLSIANIEEYVKEKKTLDKAGSYGIQDNNVVENYEGSYTNIIGLPLEKLCDLLKRIGVVYHEKYTTSN